MDGPVASMRPLQIRGGWIPGDLVVGLARGWRDRWHRCSLAPEESPPSSPRAARRAASWRRFGWEAATRGAFAILGFGSGFVFSFSVSSMGRDFPRRGTPCRHPSGHPRGAKVARAAVRQPRARGPETSTFHIRNTLVFRRSLCSFLRHLAVAVYDRLYP